MLLYAGISLLCFIAAFIAWRWARRGKRIDRHPICRKCGYDMFGRDLAELPDCPECGTQIYARKHLRLGNREPRKAVGWIALSLGVVALLASIGFTSRWAQTYDWNRVKPVSWLIREASDPSHPNAMDAALSELTRRDKHDLLSAKQRMQVIGAALDYQADTSKQWDVRWGEFVSRAEQDKFCSAEEWQRYVSQAARLNLIVREKIHVGEPFVISQEFVQPFRGDASLQQMSALYEDALFEVRAIENGKAVELPVLSFVDVFGLGTSFYRDHNSEGFDELPAGQYELTITTKLQGIEPFGDPYSSKAQFKVGPFKLKKQFEIYPKDVQLIQAVHNPKRAKQAKADMLRALNQKLFHTHARIIYGEYQKKFLIDFSIPAPSIPHYCSFDIAVYINGQWLNHVGHIVLPPNLNSNAYQFYSWNFMLPDRLQAGHSLSNPPTISKFTLRLTPNPEHLKDELDGYDYLNHWIEIKDIPVEPYRP
jgi:predicted RNA-binding Zn-ribbon protein involved in translation (DUF1610 family)